MSSPVSRKAQVIGWILGLLPVLMLVFSAVMKIAKPPMVIDGFGHMGWSVNDAVWLGVVELAVAVVYLIPRTAVLGAILVTGYLGGAIATTVRLHEGWFMTFLFGVLAWAGLYLRDSRLRALIPCRKD